MNIESNLKKSQENNFDDSQGQINNHLDTLFLFSILVLYNCVCLIL